MMQIGPHALEVLERGPADAPLLLLIHGINPISPSAPFLNDLARTHRVVGPSHPGFGASPLPADFDTMYDLTRLYLGVLDSLPNRKISVIGFSFGGWIAAELAVAGHPKLDRLILVDPVGIKLGGREERDIAHFFNTHPDTLNRLAWRDPTRRPAGSYGVGWQATINDSMSDAEMVALARNWDSLCLFAWTPHMFNPQLKRWLHRIKAPTLVLWGEHDGIVVPEYGRGYAGLIPNAKFAIIADAGHHPELEQPAAFVAQVARFLQS
ncbi:MAG: alpha/beta hydrolase [Proteobacteria bacterium]|nr:alpha/beta hydrolase [Pseudomonadota bacterium]